MAKRALTLEVAIYDDFAILHHPTDGGDFILLNKKGMERRLTDYPKDKETLKAGDLFDMLAAWDEIIREQSEEAGKANG